MPEGPEIRLAADRIAEVLVGHEIEEAWFAFDALKRYTERLRGVRVEAVDTRGKALLTRFGNGLSLYTHNQLYGRWYVRERNDLPDTNRSLRAALHTGRHSALLYSASDIEMLTAEEEQAHPFLSGLGPDVLDAGLVPSDIASRLRQRRFRRRAAGTLYLDQRFLAGIGNYLRSEILFCARVHPRSRPADLTDQKLRRLARETLRIAASSYRTRGLTVPPKMARQLKADGERYEQRRFWVFGREALPCRVCDTRIERLQVASRGLFFCPHCQPGDIP